MKKFFEEKFEVSNSFAQQTNDWCWKLDKPESTMSFGSTLTKKFPDLSILLLNGPLGAGKTTLVKGIAQSLRIQEPITSPTFPLSQHYPSGSPPLIHIDLYRLDEPRAANEFFLQQEEERNAMGALMVVEWPDRLTLQLPDAWIGEMKYIPNEQGRFFQLTPPFGGDKNCSTSAK